MALRRLLPGRKTDSTRGESVPVSGERLAETLESLATASTSATWKCRHAAGSVLVEGTVDFGARESRATVIRGKSGYEYIRRGSAAYRTPVVEGDEDAKPEWEYNTETDACGIHAYAIPEVLAAAVRASGPMSPGKPEEIGERKLVRVTATLKPKTTDADGRVARLARQLRDHGAMILTISAFVDPSGWDEVTDEPVEPRIERIRIELPHWTPADNPMDDHAISLDLFDLNEPVEIEVPDETTAKQRRTARGCSDLALF